MDPSERTPAATDDGNGLRWNVSPFVLEMERLARGRSLSGEPYRPTTHSHTAPNNQLQAVFLRLSPSCRLTQARNHSSHAPRAQHTPSSVLPTPAPRARRTYSFCCSRAARTSRTQATPGHTHMRHKPTRTTRTATRPLSLQSMRFGAWQSHAPEHNPSRQFMPRKRQTVTVQYSAVTSLQRVRRE